MKRTLKGQKGRVGLILQGVGIDIVDIKRIWKVYRSRPDRFLKRIFTLREQKELRNRNYHSSSMAARFAAKEAVSKALGTGIGKVKWTDIEIITRAKGNPRVILFGAAARVARKKGIRYIEISLSHEKQFAVACAVAFGEDTGPGNIFFHS